MMAKKKQRQGNASARRRPNRRPRARLTVIVNEELYTLDARARVLRSRARPGETLPLDPRTLAVLLNALAHSPRVHLLEKDGQFIFASEVSPETRD